MRVDVALGIDESEFSWTVLAACRDMMPSGPKTDWFFNAYENTDVARAADSICMSCPVQAICGNYAVENKEEGLWGGVYWTPQGKPDATRNAHKTDEAWALLEDRLGMKFTRKGGRSG